MNKGKIIFLNGVSSAGKTTLAKALQDHFAERFFCLAVDTFFHTAPAKYWEQDFAANLQAAASGMHHAIRAYSDAGMNVVVDHVLIKPFGFLEECVRLLHDYPVLFVHVTCPVEELRRRESARGNREEGQGEAQLELLEPQDGYDLTIDTFAHPTEDCVRMIEEKLAQPETFTAFQTLWRSREGEV